jgi:hypothetical protein
VISQEETGKHGGMVIFGEKLMLFRIRKLGVINRYIGLFVALNQP